MDEHRAQPGRSGRTDEARDTRADLAAWRAVLFDMDDVLLDTTSAHLAALREVVGAHLRRLGDGEPVGVEEYARHLEGRERYAGMRALLAARGAALPFGAPDDPCHAETVCGLANRKNARFLELVRERGIRVYPSTVVSARLLRERGVRTALVTSSRNGGPLLACCGLPDLFDAVLDGEAAARLNLPAKPAPDVYLRAARALDVAPADAAVVEDSAAGIRAARGGGFGLVLGLARRPETAPVLREAGAHAVAPDLGRIAPARPPA